MRILTTPWKNELLELIADSEQSIKITSPFVKESICRELINAKKSNAEVYLITSFRLPSIYSGSLDLSALELIMSNKGRVKNFSKLHSKIYLFDDKQAVITSSNLTAGGLLKNFEYGILTDDPNIISEICKDFQSLWDGENTGNIRRTDIDLVKGILAGLPKIETVKFPTFSIDTDSPEQNFDVLKISNNVVQSSLSGWKLEVFNCLNKITTQNFTLNDVYVFENYLQQTYPINRNIKDKIRQQLQYLRDLGLVEFLGAGSYRKLWK